MQRLPAVLRTIGFIVLAALLLGSAWIAWERHRRGPALTFVVPDDYIGYLIPRWECPGGLSLTRTAWGGGSEQTIQFESDGTACIADAIPQGGFRVIGYREPDGEVAHVILGGTKGLQGNLPVGETEFVFSPLASIGIGNGRILGDECSLHDFLVERFGVPRRGIAGECEPIYTLPNPAIPATPGLPAGPG